LVKATSFVWNDSKIAIYGQSYIEPNIQRLTQASFTAAKRKYKKRVVEMRVRGMTHQEIASKLQVSRTAITSDVQYLREQAKWTIKEYVTEHLPEQYQVCLSALDATDTKQLVSIIIILTHRFE